MAEDPINPIDIINDDWKKDCKIDQTNLGNAAARVGELHAKYLVHLTDARLAIRKVETELLKLRKVKVRYYNSELPKEELAAKKWNPYGKTRPLKTELLELIECDDDILEVGERLEKLKTFQVQVESIMKSISSRGWDIKSAIQWHTFTNGG
jgi:hypothetical protein